jgi:hypothetical protein
MRILPATTAVALPRPNILTNNLASQYKSESQNP